MFATTSGRNTFGEWYGVLSLATSSEGRRDAADEISASSVRQSRVASRTLSRASSHCAASSVRLFDRCAPNPARPGSLLHLLTSSALLAEHTGRARQHPSLIGKLLKSKTTRRNQRYQAQLTLSRLQQLNAQVQLEIAQLRIM